MHQQPVLPHSLLHSPQTPTADRGSSLRWWKGGPSSWEGRERALSRHLPGPWGLGVEDNVGGRGGQGPGDSGA